MSRGRAGGIEPSRTPGARRVALLVLLTAGSALAGCGEEAGETARASGERERVDAGPEPLRVEPRSEGLVFRYRAPEGGVATAAEVDAIPREARGEVVVFDPDEPPPPGWDHVADLTSGLPTEARPVEGFELDAGGTRAVGAREPKVELFTRPGCPHCARARKWLRSRDVRWEEHDLSSGAGAKERLRTLARRADVPRSKLRGVPIVFVVDAPRSGRRDEGSVEAMVGFDAKRLEGLLSS